MDDTRNPTQDGQANVDQEVRAASALQEDTQRRQDEGQDDLTNVSVLGVTLACKLINPVA